MKKSIYLSLIVLLTLPPFAGKGHAGDTPETLLIRQSLANDISGYRRSNTELALKTYGQHFVTYQAHANGDPRAWTVLYESRDALADQMASDLKTWRYEVTRTVPFVNVRGNHAIATSIDSGQVIDRQSGVSTPVDLQRLWIFFKSENTWLATAMVTDLGDSLLPATSTASKGEITEFLQRESKSWEEGSALNILELFDEHFTGYYTQDTFQPSTWKIAFNGTEEMEKWLEKRLPFVHYALERQVLHSAIGPSGDEALAVTRETVAVTHINGPAKHQKERYVFWTMSRRSGSWKITNMLYDLGLADE